MAEWKLAATARTGFADMVESASPEQLTQPTLCDQWTAKGVLAHLVGFVETGGFAFIGGLLTSGFNFDKFSVKLVDKRMDRSVEDLARSLRDNGAKSAPMPMFPEGMTVSDVAIHTQDVRRPLGLPGELDPAVLRATLEFLTTQKLATTLVDRRPIDGVRLVATDLDWSFGDGPEITGSGEAIMMGLANRPVLEDLSGDGLSNWS